MRDLRLDCHTIVKEALEHVQPHAAVQRALSDYHFDSGRILLVSVGKAAWSMASSAYHTLGDQVTNGIVITKHGYSLGAIGSFAIYEAGHPVPDLDTISATTQALIMTEDLAPNDTVLFLLSGGGSSLFEFPLIPPEELQNITQQLLACGADITEINIIRKRLSSVKGGRFAQHCAPAHVYSIILSDILGDPLDMIASGPTVADQSTSEQAVTIAKKYQLELSDSAWMFLRQETPKELENTYAIVTGSVKELCSAAAVTCEMLGYEVFFLTDCLSCEARDAGSFLASIARSHQNIDHSIAFIAGGETVVHLTGNGKGGRNQELALSAAAGIAGLNGTAIFSVGSDGTDGPTDAAGAFVDGTTYDHLKAQNIDIFSVLQQNDSYSALERCSGLIKTGPTGTNVNDLAVLLIRR